MTARILAYHRLADETAPVLRTWAVRPVVFRRQMRLLNHLGYRGVSVGRLLNSLEGGSGERLIGLSFDDGYRDTVEIGLPILKSLGFTATIYIVADAVGGWNSWETDGPAVPLAGWSELEALVAAGWEIGLHSRSHLDHFDRLAGRELAREVQAGRCRVQERLGAVAETFAYPHGQYSPATLRAVQEADYRAGLTTTPGVVSAETPRFELPRYEIKRRDTLLEFGLLLLTGVLPRRRETLRRFRPLGRR